MEMWMNKKRMDGEGSGGGASVVAAAEAAVLW